MDAEPNIQDILLPGLFESIFSLLDDSTVAKLKQQSTNLNKIISKEQESNAYWKPRVQELLNIGIPMNTILNWKEVYKRMKTDLIGGIVSTFPSNLLIGWIHHQFSILALQSTEDELFTEVIIKVVIEYNRLDVLDDLRELIKTRNTDKLFNVEWFAQAALESDGGWNILRHLIPELVEKINSIAPVYRNPIPYKRSIIKLLSAAARSSDLAHFILVERLFETYEFDESFHTTFMKTILSSKFNVNLAVIGYYITKYPEISLDFATHPKFLVNDRVSYSVATFLIRLMTFQEFQALMYVLNRVESLYKVSGGVLLAVLESPNIDSDTVEFFREKVYSIFSTFRLPYSLTPIVKLLSLDASKILAVISSDNYNNLETELFKYLLISKRVPEPERSNINEILRLRGWNLKLSDTLPETFTSAEAQKLARHLSI